MPRVNPAILRWARETAGLSREDAAKRIDLAATRSKTAAERIAELEDGLADPSRPLLLRMAKKYRRPLIAFYLPAPPARGNRGQDFRTLPEDHDEADESLLDALVRDVLSRQSLIRDAIEDEDSPEPLSFIGSLRVDTGVAATAERILQALANPIPSFRSAATAEAAFSVLRERAESLGIFVVLLGNLGSHHSSLNLETFRGLAVADPIAPFVVINDQDSRAAWSFSLIHEMTHLWLGQTGVSGGAPERDVERFCNDVAGELLLPSAELLNEYRTVAPTAGALERWIDDVAARAHVSRTMIAYRLFAHDLVTRTRWMTLTRHYRAQWLASRERRREVARAAAGGGPSFYVVRRQRLGNALLGTAYRLMSAGAMTTAKTARVLGVKPTQVEPLFSLWSRRARAG